MGNSMYKKDPAVEFVDSYFVRLSNQKSIYFTETEADTVVLGHMKINKV
jgi:hypothetical protein